MGNLLTSKTQILNNLDVGSCGESVNRVITKLMGLKEDIANNKPLKNILNQLVLV
jgi:hypothetical protein